MSESLVYAASGVVRAYASHCVAVALNAAGDVAQADLYDMPQAPTAEDPVTNYVKRVSLKAKAGEGQTFNMTTGKGRGASFGKGIYLVLTGADAQVTIVAD